MNPTSSNPASCPIPFPRRDGIPSTFADEADVLARAAEIHELCRDISSTLQEIRHAVLNTLYEIIERLDLDAATLVQVPLASRRELEKHSRERAIRFIDAIQPQKIVVNGRATYKFLGGKLDDNPDSLPQAISGSIEDIPAMVSYHLSGARMSTKTREAVKQRVREVSGYNQYLNNR
jgi:hypothetical protein